MHFMLEYASETPTAQTRFLAPNVLNAIVVQVSNGRLIAAVGAG